MVNINVHPILIIALILLVLVIIWGGIYRCWLLKQMRHMKYELEIQQKHATVGEKTKSAFLDSISHEIRTPLNAINGFTDLILDPYFDTNTKKEFAQIIYTNTTLLTELMVNIVDVAELNSTHGDLSTEPVDVTAICENCMERAISVSDKDKVEFVLNIPDSPLMLRTNNIYFERVVQNLLSNAYKFTENGKIELACKLDNIRRRLIVSISDNGTGVPEEMRELIFERFTKLNSFSQGTGLGLYVCRLIANRLHGRIFIDPDYTKGARFVFELDECIALAN